jgi:V8-like Glu-specific endopeptidase
MIKKTFLSCFILLYAFSALAQKAMQYGLTSPAASLQVPKQDKQRLLDEDEQQGKGRLRCAVLLPLQVAFPDDVVPEKVADGTVWRMKIEAEDAEAINLYLTDFQLPKGVELSFYTPDFEYRLPTVSSDENPKNKIYVTDHIQGSSMIVELFAYQGVEVRHCFTVKDVGYMYRPLPQWLKGSKGFGDSEDCEVNVNCPEGADWQNEKKGVARILLVAGGEKFWCSGSLINNARNDKTPYFLTASHCALNTTEEEFPLWKFYFNYESSTCVNPEKEPSFYVTTGCERIAEADYYAGNSDFLLLKLDDEVSSNPNLYFNGWNISSTPASSGVGIHHPLGDIKKISTYTKLQDYTELQWLVQWTKTQTNWGVTEKGSSGSPIFDQNKYIIGTLSAGDADCATPLGEDLYGKMSYHWNKNGDTDTLQLKPWLDPDNKGIIKLNGEGEGEGEPETDILVYPNPADGELTVKILDVGYEISDIVIYDVMGRLQKINNRKSEIGKSEIVLDVSTLSAGLYIMIITHNNGRKTHKIIKL